MSATRDVSFILRMLRSVLLGRRLKPQLRFKGQLSLRPPAMPTLPYEPRHALSNYSYFKRDTRRMVTAPKEIVNVIHKGQRIEAKVGQSLMSAAIAAGIEIEAACDGNLACSTCHVYIDNASFKKLPPASDEEEDMIDLALFVQPTSRLSCQLILTNELDGLEFCLPAATRNYYADKKDKT
ncbi:Ferredoxin-2, mitochondrial, partial [Fragariocoptes setiger]